MAADNKCGNCTHATLILEWRPGGLWGGTEAQCQRYPKPEIVKRSYVCGEYTLGPVRGTKRDYTGKMEHLDRIRRFGPT